jgi:hypothetical protein
MTSVDRYGIYVSQMTYAPFVEFATRGTRRVSHVEQEMYTLWNVATYKGKVHNGKIEIISYVVKIRP